jgi:HD-like signal output (HDOD) protein
MSYIEKIIRNVKDLHTLPSIYYSLSESINDPYSSLEKLARVISFDQVSSFKILKVANSSFYGFRGRINTISQAVLHLGFNEIKNIVFALSILKTFTKIKNIMNFRPVDLWAHSIGVGIAARLIGEKLGERDIENYFLAGIVHDIGKILFIEFLPEDYLKVLKYVQEKNCSTLEAESEILGINHCKAGHLLAEKWKLPAQIRDIIYFHHTGKKDGQFDRITAAVHVADIFVKAIELGNTGDNLIPEPNFNVWEKLNLPEGFFSSILNKLKENFRRNVRIMLTE